MKTIGFLRLLERSTEERGEKEPKDGKKVLESLVRYQVHCIYEISVFLTSSSSSGPGWGDTISITTTTAYFR